MKIEIVKPTADHVDYFSESLRKVDVLEMWLADHSKPFSALQICAFSSDKSYVVEADGVPVIIFGVDRDGLSENGRVWMLATDDLEFMQKSFIKRCKKVFFELVEDFDMVYNYVYEKNEIALKWLKWLGFTIHPAITFGVECAMFHRVEFKGK